MVVGNSLTDNLGPSEMRKNRTPPNPAAPHTHLAITLRCPVSRERALTSISYSASGRCHAISMSPVVLRRVKQKECKR